VSGCQVRFENSLRVDRAWFRYERREILSQIHGESLQRSRGRWRLGRAQSPKDLAEDTQSEFRVSGRKVKAVDETADFLFGRSGRAPFRGTARTRFQIAAGAESGKQERGETLEISGAGRDMFLRFHGILWIAREFVQADGYGLAKVHGAVSFVRGNADEPMAMAKVFIRKTALLRTEKQRDAATREMLPERTPRLIQAADRVLQLSLTHRGCADDECAVLNGFGEVLELFRASKQRYSADGGTRFSKGQLIRVDDPKMKETEVAHGPGGGADVERIARGHKNHTQSVGISVGEHRRRVYRRKEATRQLGAEGRLRGRRWVT